jgi:hypothetical protein
MGFCSGSGPASRGEPERLGYWKTVHERHRRWSADGTRERIFQAALTGAGLTCQVHRAGEGGLRPLAAGHFPVKFGVLGQWRALSLQKTAAGGGLACGVAIEPDVMRPTGTADRVPGGAR